MHQLALMIRQLFKSFHPRHQPWITRQSYSHELIFALTFPVALALVEGSVAGILAKKVFHVGPMLFATIMSAPMFANLTSFLWARLARCRTKVRFMNMLQLMLLVSIGGIALLPTSTWGKILLTGLMVWSRCLLTGIITIRSTIWRMNYPRPVRAQVTGKLALINSLNMTVAPLVGYALFDHDPNVFRLIYPASLLIALVGVFSFARVRLRGERELLRYEADPRARPQPHGAPGPIYEYDPKAGRDGFWSVLRRDLLYRRYMQWQFLGGLANMMGDVAVVYVIIELTKHHDREYLVSVALSTALPMLLATLTLPVWARYLDRIHVVRLRVPQSVLWIASQMLNWLGASLGSLGVLALSRTVVGVSRGGGMLAWTLGHNDFADRRLVVLYMGIHVTLTGVRGAIGPFLAMALLTGWSDETFGRFGLGGAGFPGIGHHVFLITTILAVISMVGFVVLDRRIRGGEGRSQ